MKHDFKITAILVLFFILAQIVGLILINIDISEIKVVDGQIELTHADTSLGPRPEITGLGAFAYIAIGIAIGTLLVLLIIRAGKINIWKAWFFLAVFIATSMALGVVMNNYLALGIALVLALIKIFKPNVFIHNLTEVLMYAGIAVFLVPLLNVFWTAILLIVISIYDIYAVWKSKHMVKMAKFQAKSQVFAGLFIPYKSSTSKTRTKIDMVIKPPKTLRTTSKAGKTFKNPEQRNAILGGGDIAFPLLFTGVVMESLLTQGLPKLAALSQSLIITLTTTIALALLFIFAKKDKFYPAMPFISAGCFIGYFIVLLL
ncbi:MAG: hypothetical protein KKF46_02450 [Nanoarchaeota archaeon]|nr:hypothetical protein [Nanoarchaeota archaeon]MBU1321193.1 hypothetical protein [Nanoarchaeota archaeon]MBU1598461.1 hypothetical protein [Nanoarchaeota archaeon]MBU2441394.1 hypothetical protein [Nanoarchaeota archaeon]